MSHTKPEPNATKGIRTTVAEQEKTRATVKHMALWQSRNSAKPWIAFNKKKILQKSLHQDDIDWFHPSSIFNRLRAKLFNLVLTFLTPWHASLPKDLWWKQEHRRAMLLGWAWPFKIYLTAAFNGSMLHFCRSLWSGIHSCVLISWIVLVKYYILIRT